MSVRVSYPGPGHILVAGAPRCNKTAGVLIPNFLKLKKRPLIAFNDCRGEIYETIVRERSKDGPVFVANPFGLRGFPSDGFNTLIDLDPNDPSFFASMLAYGESTVTRRASEAQPIFNLSSQTLVSIMGGMAKLRHGEKASHGHVQTMISLAAAAQAAEEGDAASAIIAQAIKGDYGPKCPYPQYRKKPFEPLSLLAEQFRAQAGKDNKFFRDRINYAQAETCRLGDPLLMTDMAKHPTFKGKPFQWADMRRWVDPKKKKGVITVIVMMPPEYFVSHAVYMRMMVASAINALMKTHPSPDAPLVPVIAIEEMAQLGEIPAIINTINMAAGNGIQFMLVVQQLSKLLKTYGEEGIGTILDACDVKLCFCSEDEYTQERLSNQGGVKGAWVKNWTRDPEGKMVKHENAQSVPLVRPQDIRALQKGEAYCWIKHAPPVKLLCPGYFKEDEWPDLRGRWDENTILPMNQRAA